MDELNPKKEPDITIRDLYPHFTEEQLKDAEENLRRYLELALRIYERIRSNPDEYARFRSLTDLNRRLTMHPTGSINTSPSDPST